MFDSRPSEKHPSVLALLRANPDEANAEAIIRRLARDKVKAAKQYSWSGPPYCPKSFSSLFGIRCKEVDHDIGGDGRILKYPDGRIYIEYKSGRLLERQRFTIFHEFAHTLFPDYCELLPHHQATHGKLSSAEREFEHLCDVGASEMLLPREDFLSDLNLHSSLSFALLQDLSVRYQSSLEAATYRAVELWTATPTAAIFLTDQNRGFGGSGPLWVNHQTRHKSFKDFIRPGTVPPPSSVVFQCYHENLASTLPVPETWITANGRRNWIIQASRLPDIPTAPAYPKVLVLVSSAPNAKLS